jgi:hypothetical protein
MARRKRDRSLERACDKAIINTLKYRSVFKASMSRFQLGTYLISDREIPADIFESRIKGLLKSKKIKQYKGSYHLVRKKPLSWSLRAKYSQNHIQKTNIGLELLKSIKWIKLMAITGSVAAYNSKKNDDVDLFIISEKNRIWLTRFFVVLILKALGKYRTDKSYNNKLCPNIYMDETRVRWSEEKRNIYVAHDIIMMQPVINKDDMYFRFLNANRWVFEYFPHFKVQCPEKFGKGTKFNSDIVDFLELVFMSVQLWYMRKRQTTEIVSKEFIHFLREDHSEDVLQKFEDLKK